MKPYTLHSMVCPRCAATAWRMPRGFTDRLRSLFVPNWRFGCTSSLCGWQGLVPRGSATATRHVARSIYAHRRVLEPARGARDAVARCTP